MQTQTELSKWHGRLVKQLRERKGIKQGELGAAMGMSKQWAHSFERGFIELRISVALRLGEILDVDPNIFLPTTSHKMSKKKGTTL